MAKLKKGFEYFPLEVSLDDNIELIEAELGLEAFAVIIKLWQKIYKSGYYIEWDKDNITLFSKRVGINKDKLIEIVGCCFERGVFNKEMVDEFKILTSRGIQKRYLLISKQSKRKDCSIENCYNLINSEEYNNYSEECGDYSEVFKNNSEECVEFSEFEQQSKLKELKEKKINNKKESKLLNKFINEIILLTGNSLLTVERAILKSEVKDTPEMILEKAIINIREPNEFLKGVHLNFYTKIVNIEDLANGKYLPVDEKEEENKKYKPLVM